jgi:murein DD-endopeptidase MepM/ murein hydrolase activator NlpD
VSRTALVAFGAGIIVAALIGRRRKARPMLGSPVESAAWLTPHGAFGAERSGPPRHAHQGVDLWAAPGSRVLAVGDGRIVQTRPGLGGIVRKLELDEPGAFAPALLPVDTIVYADLGRPLVQPGDRVRRGDAIGIVGARGFVHFAVKQGETFIDPRLAGFAYTKSVVS